MIELWNKSRYVSDCSRPIELGRVPLRELLYRIRVLRGSSHNGGGGGEGELHAPT